MDGGFERLPALTHAERRNTDALLARVVLWEAAGWSLLTVSYSPQPAPVNNFEIVAVPDELQRTSLTKVPYSVHVSATK